MADSGLDVLGAHLQPQTEDTRNTFSNGGMGHS